MVNKKILLVSPMNPLGQGSSFPPLGLATNASYISENYDVSIFDEGIEGKLNSDLCDADIVGISVNTLTARRSYDLSREFMDKGIPTILGGIHPTVMPEEASKYATSIVIGNGEPVWKEILGDYERNNLKKIYSPSLFDLKDSRVPRRDLFGKYYTNNIQTSRGCPNRCKFCTVHKVHGLKYRSKPLNLVEEDLKSLKKRLIWNDVLLVDDNFYGIVSDKEETPTTQKRAISLLNLLKENNIRWIGQTTLNIAHNPKMLKLARESGAIAFYIGFESLNEEFLKSVNKSINLKEKVSSYKESIRKIQDYGICVLGSFIYGTDFDTRDELLKLRDFVIDSNIDTTYIKPLQPFPGTSIYEEFKQQKRIFREDYWMQDPYPVFTFKPKKMTMDELMEVSLEFLNLYTPSRSIKRFGKSLLSTKNFWGSFDSFLSNLGDGIMYKKYYEDNREKIILGKL